MQMTEQNWQEEYRTSLEKLTFSQGEKQRFVQELTDTREAVLHSAPRRPLRMAAAMAALCALLSVTAAAATLWRNSVHFADSMEEAARLAGNHPSDTAASVGKFYEDDWEYRPPVEEVSAWWGSFETHGAAETAGKPDDGWTKKRSYREWMKQHNRYLGTCLSDFAGLWEGTPWDVAEVEREFTPIAGTQTAYTCYEFGTLWAFEVIGAYEREDGAAFTLQYEWDSETEYGETYLLSEGLESGEQYTTADGVEVAVSTARSRKGELLFWAEYVSGHRLFSMTGRNLEMDAIHALLDGMGLARMCAGD